MPAPEMNGRYQDAVVFPPGSYNDMGRVVLGASRQIKVRWIEDFRNVSLPGSGSVVSAATVVVGEDLDVDTVMWLGTLDDWNSAGSAGDDGDLLQVVDYKKVPDVKSRFYYREVLLTRYKGNL